MAVSPASWPDRPLPYDLLQCVPLFVCVLPTSFCFLCAAHVVQMSLSWGECVCRAIMANWLVNLSLWLVGNKWVPSTPRVTT